MQDIKTNYEATIELIKVIEPYISVDNLKIRMDENKDWRGSKYKTDYVVVIEKNNVSFEVYDNEIIVSYFKDHCHFEDYSSELQEGQADYIERAKEFLATLFSSKIKHIQKYKGSKLVSEKYSFVYPDGEVYEGGTWYGLIHMVNPFAKKIEKTAIWKYEKEKGIFEQKESNYENR